MQPLLGYLARFGSFSSQSELLCTQGLTHLLQTHKDARVAMAREIGRLTGVEVSRELSWQAEVRQPDGARPDLEAQTDTHVPVVKIEAKLGAGLLPNQVQSYWLDLQNRGDDETALLILVAKSYVSEATKVTVSALGLRGSGPWPVTDEYRCGIAVLSWDQLFDALKVDDCPQFGHELAQLQAMYRVLSGDYIAPLADIDELREWKAREADIVNVVDKVTRHLTTEHAVYPMGSEPLEGTAYDEESGKYRRRYVCRSSDNTSPCFSIGVRDSFAEWVTPVWMRFHKDTGAFALIRERIEASSLRWLESGGHVWIPLDVPVGVSGEQMVQSLVNQVEAVLDVTHITDRS